jgi:hypothetical protein
LKNIDIVADPTVYRSILSINLENLLAFAISVQGSGEYLDYKFREPLWLFSCRHPKPQIIWILNKTTQIDDKLFSDLEEFAKSRDFTMKTS